MAKALFKMKFGGFSKGKSKVGNDFYKLKLLEIIENYGNEEVDLITLFGKEISDDVCDKFADLLLFDDIEVVLDVSSSGKQPKFISFNKL